MSPRYLLFAGSDVRKCAELIQCISERSGVPLRFSNDRIAALADPSCPCLAVGEAGCVLGFLFHRNGPARAVASLTSDEAAAISGREGQTLITSFWGRYVAAIAGPHSVRTLRDPSGDFPCYFTQLGSLTVFASDAEILVKSGLVRPCVETGEIGRQLFRAFVPVAATALQGVRELLAGFALRAPLKEKVPEQCWNPWDHVGCGDEEPNEAAERLARTIRHAVHSIAAPAGRLLLSVSGGLDSSIVGACLAQARVDAVCLTMFSDDPAGDERVFARALCEKAGLTLIERPYRLDDIDLDAAMAANLPRPKDRMQALAFERVHYAVASEIGADAFITGNGGDHVFGYSQSAAPIADRYLAQGLGRSTVGSLVDVCRQTGCSVADAVRQAWRLAHSPPGYRVRPNPLFLHPDFVAGVGSRDWHHPWLDAPLGALPGKAAHVATILRVQPNLEPSLGDRYPVLNPLVSQPIVEACLRVPSWEWREGARDRALVRRAFANDLPALVLDRRVKGTPGRFAAQLLDRFRTAIRDRLVSGRLAADGIIDAASIERTLHGERPVPDLERVRVLELVNAEAWIGHWTARAQTFEPIVSNVRSAVHGQLPSSGGPTP